MLLEARACEVVCRLASHVHRKQRELSAPHAHDVELLARATVQLQQLSDNGFDHLLLDAYDEMDRRETAEVWDAVSKAACDVPPDCVLVPFLPVTPGLPAVRLQVRHREKEGRKRGGEWL